jgi:hypothetical protein
MKRSLSPPHSSTGSSGERTARWRLVLPSPRVGPGESSVVVGYSFKPGQHCVFGYLFLLFYFFVEVLEFVAFLEPSPRSRLFKEVTISFQFITKLFQDTTFISYQNSPFPYPQPKKPNFPAHSPKYRFFD